jgi:alpha-tubulin suppressor-like RCC1 family protein
MNVTNLILYLRSKIGDTSLDQQMLAKAIKLLELGAINTVSSFSSLPSVSTARIDELYLVEFDGLYRTNGSNWIPFTQQNFSPTFAWGCNASGQLGNNTTVSSSSPVLVVGGFADWCQVSAGCGNSLAVRCNGTAWGWGNGGNGQLGDNAAGLRSSPFSVVGGFTDWCQVSAGDNHSLGVRQNGTAWAWGSAGLFGKLGDNSTTQKSSPVSVVGGFTDWCQLSAGLDHSLGVRQNGSAWAWGSGSTGSLGDNTSVNKSSPVSVVGGFTDWCQLSAGCGHSLGVRINGTAWAWGSGVLGRLGNNCTTDRSSPVSVIGGFTDWCQVSAGSAHSLGVRQSGTLYAWGNGGNGRLGDNTANTRSSPVLVVGGFTDWCQVSAGWAHSLGLRQNGSAWAWGCNAIGQLGDNSTVSRSSPVSVVGGFTNWCQASAGGYHSLAIRNEQP